MHFVQVRSPAIGVLFLVSCTLQPVHAQVGPSPVSGTAHPTFGAADRVVLEHMQRIGARAAVVAIARNRAPVHARGFGHEDGAATRPTPPDALMRIASVTKPITAAAVRHLIAERKLGPQQRVLAILGPRTEQPRDARWSAITVAHLLEHRGGWDRGQSFDPLFQIDRITRTLGLSTTARPRDVLRYMLRQPLQFDPGGRVAYSNFGYSVLGRLVETVSRTSYINYVRQKVLGPHGIHDILLGRSRFGTRYAREVDYPPSGLAFYLEVMDSAGGLVGSAPALLKFMKHYWLNGVPRAPDVQGNYSYFGALPGTTALARQRADGTDYVVLMNGPNTTPPSGEIRRLSERIERALGEPASGGPAARRGRR